MFLMEDDLQSSIEVLRKGGLILYPTDTVWGIGCDATNETAVAKVFELKKKGRFKGLDYFSRRGRKCFRIYQSN